LIYLKGFGVRALVSTSKVLAQMNKSPNRGKATKNRIVRLDRDINTRKLTLYD